MNSFLELLDALKEWGEPSILFLIAIVFAIVIAYLYFKQACSDRRFNRKIESYNDECSADRKKLRKCLELEQKRTDKLEIKVRQALITPCAKGDCPRKLLHEGEGETFL